jgi:arylsulfatase A-like enzyme
MRRNGVLVGAILAVALALGLAALAASRSVGGTAPATPAGAPPAPPAGRPNVLIIVTDDARQDTLATMPKTLRWLAEGGVTFLQGYVTTPSCCPSRASILSGRYVHNHGVLQQRLAEQLNQGITLQRYLKDRGWFTAIAGKFLNRWPLRRPPPHFDRYALANGGYYDQRWGVDGKVRRVSAYSTTFIGDKTLEYLAEFERDDARPWFAYVAPFAPHDPHVPEPRYAKATFPARPPPAAFDEPDVADKPPYLRNRRPVGETAAEALRTAQLRTLLSVDDLVDRILRRLQETGELDNTLIFYLSDNGYSWGEHRYTGKFVPYTEAVKVPFLVRWPGHLPAGAVDNRTVANIDLKPTVLAAAGIQPDADDTVDGRSLLGSGGRDRLLLEYWHDPANARRIPTWASLRTPAWQYVENYDQQGGRIYREYYDLVRDPAMVRNLLADADPANDPPDGLGDELAAARRCAGDGCP